MEQPGRELLGNVGGDDLLGRPPGELNEVREVCFAWVSPQPDWHGPVAGVVG